MGNVLCTPPKDNSSKSNGSKDQFQSVSKDTSADHLDLNTEDLVRGRTGTVETEYQLLASIGKGAFGEVKKGIHKRTGQIRAIKIIHKLKQTAEEQAALIREVEILKKLDHPNIIKVYEFYESDKNFFIVTDLCEGKELFDKIIDEGHFREASAAVVFKSILSAVAYCHSHKIVHRDIKPENILFEDKKGLANLKLIDFGASTVFRQDEKMFKLVGTPYYIAPEILGGAYDEKVDEWSCGIILYILLCGYPPFNGPNNEKIFDAIKTSKLRFDDEDWSGISKEARALIGRLLDRNPASRISASEGLRHEWFEKVSKKTELDPKKAADALNKLKRFHAGRKLQDAIYLYMSDFLLSKDESNEIIEQFKQFDKNGDGQISKEELAEGYERVFGKSLSSIELDKIMDEIDKNKSGFIDYSEFVTAVINKDTLLTEERLEKAFKLFDKDSSGKISISELKDIFGEKSKLSEKDWKNLIKEADENGDGEISHDEFLKFMKKLACP